MTEPAVRYHFETRERSTWDRRASSLAEWESILMLVEHWRPLCAEMRALGSTADKVTPIKHWDGDRLTQHNG